MIRDLLWSWRQALRYPRETAATVCILALTCAAATALFSTILPLWLAPLPFPEADRLVVLWEETRDRPNPGYTTSLGIHSETVDALAGIVDLAISRPTLPVLWLDDRPMSLVGARVSTNFLRVLGIQPSLGRDFRPEDEDSGLPIAVLISHRIWQSQFGSDPDLESLRARLDFGNEVLDARVIGVLPRQTPIGKPLVWDRVDILSVLPTVRVATRNHFAARSYRLIGRLRTDGDLQAVREQSSAKAGVAADSFPEMFRDWRLRVERAVTVVVAPYRRALNILTALTLLVLVAACINIAIILSARHGNRAGELDLRLALGALPWLIHRLLIVEGLLLAGLAVIPGLLGAQVLLAQLRGLSRDRSLQEIQLEPAAVGFAICLCISMAIAFSFLPRIGASRESLSLNLGARSPHRQEQWQRRLLSLEIAAGVLILTTTITVMSGFSRLLAIDPGFSPEHLLTVDLRQSTAFGSARDPALYEQAAHAVRQMPAVEGAGVVRFLPMSGFTLTIEARPETGDGMLVGLDGIGPNAFKTLAVPLIKGRRVEAFDLSTAATPAAEAAPIAAGEYPVWISESLATRLVDGPIVGRPLHLSFLDAQFRVAGIVGDVRRQSLGDVPQPMVYVPFSLLQRLHAHLLLRVSDPFSVGTQDAVRQTLESLDPRLVVERLRPLTELIDQTTERERIMAFLCAALTLLALALTTSGVWAVAGHRVERRRREMAIRSALGAAPKSLRSKLLKRMLIDTVIGVVAGWITGFLLADASATFLFEDARFQIGPLLIASFWLVALAVVASYLAARRLRRVEVAEILRED